MVVTTDVNSHAALARGAADASELSESPHAPVTTLMTQKKKEKKKKKRKTPDCCHYPRGRAIFAAIGSLCCVEVMKKNQCIIYFLMSG